MSCGCVYVEHDGDLGFYAGAETRKAIKEHKCVECSRTIEPGEKYEYASGCWEAGWKHFKTCSDCLSVRKEFFCGGLLFAHMYNDLYYHIEDMDGNIKSECLNKLTPRAKSKVIGMIDSYFAECDKLRERLDRLGKK